MTKKIRIVRRIKCKRETGYPVYLYWDQDDGKRIEYRIHGSTSMTHNPIEVWFDFGGKQYFRDHGYTGIGPWNSHQIHKKPDALIEEIAEIRGEKFIPKPSRKKLQVAQTTYQFKRKKIEEILKRLNSVWTEVEEFCKFSTKFTKVDYKKIRDLRLAIAAEYYNDIITESPIYDALNKSKYE